MPSPTRAADKEENASELRPVATLGKPNVPGRYGLLGATKGAPAQLALPPGKFPPKIVGHVRHGLDFSRWGAGCAGAPLEPDSVAVAVP